MNQLQKRSLLITLVLALQYFLLIGFKLYLPIILATLLITIIAAWFYSLDIKLKKEDLTANIRFLILPFLFNFGSVFFVLSMLQPIVAYLLITLILIANFYLMIAIKRVFNLEGRAAIFQRNVLISIAFVSVFLSIAALYRFFVSYSINPELRLPLTLVIALSALIFYSVSHFLAWENGIDLKKFKPYNLVMTLLGAEVAWASSIWIVNYPVFSQYEKAGLGGVPLPAVVLAIIFYFNWGVISHKSDRSLTRNVIFEYFILTILFLAVLFISAQWLPQA